MGYSRRRFVLGAVLVLVSIVAISGLRLAWEWRQALSDVDAMIVPTRSLPPTQQPTQVADAPQHGKGVAATTQELQPTPLPVPSAEPNPEHLEPINILLLGTDTRPDQGVTRTDAMILVHINPASGRVSMLSLPRDLWVEIPGFGHQRINAAYPIGEKQLGHGYGGALAKETVGNLVGVPVQHFILVDFEGFKKVIDTIGGVTLDVQKPIDDPNYPTDDYNTIAVHFGAGKQHMDGERALIYARTRHADSDFGRNQRQQQVLMAIFEAVRDQGLLKQITSLDDYTGALRDYVRTDISRSDMLSLARMADKFQTDNIQRYAIGPDMIVGLQQPATFAADPAALRAVVAEMTGAGAAVEP